MARGVRLHGGPFRRGVIGGIGFFPALASGVSKDPDEALTIVADPGVHNLKAAAPAERRDQSAPFVHPGIHLARLDGVDPQLVLHWLQALAVFALENHDRNLAR